jgi:hypothetical protein
MRDLSQRPVPMAVRLRVSGMPVIVMMMVVIVMMMMMMMGVPVMAAIPLIRVPVINVMARPGDQRHMRGVDSRAEHFRRREIVSHTQTAQGPLQLGQRQSRVEQRAQDHVPGRARKTVEVHHPRHESHPDSFIEQ